MLCAKHTSASSREARASKAAKFKLRYYQELSMAAQLPMQKLEVKLIVLWAFDRGEDGELVPA